MEIERKYKGMILASFVVTVLVFLAGILLGVGLNDLRNQDAFASLKTVSLNTESYVVEGDFIEFYGVNLTEEQFCSNLRDRFYSLSDELNDIRHLVVSFEDANDFQGDDYDFLVREYFLTEIQLYLSLENFRSQCDDSIDSIVFFYGLDAASETQGTVMDALIKERDDIFVITLKKDYNEGVSNVKAKDPLFDLFEDYFEIDVTPSLIVNGEKHEGIVNYPNLNGYLDDDV